MAKRAFIGVLAPLLLLGGPAWADWRTPISGAAKILATRFTPMGYTIEHPAPPPVPAPAPQAAAELAPDADPAAQGLIAWSIPLVDRKLSVAERAAGIAPELQDAILRIEPIFDPTRLDAAYVGPRMRVSAGTAAMDNVFADRWRQASPDANVNLHVKYIAEAWHMTGALPCDSFTKRRAHGFQYGEPTLDALSAGDCALLLHGEARGFEPAPPVPIAVGAPIVPVFAAPMPGLRLSSADFWAARRAQIAAIRARMRQDWHGGGKGIEVGLLRR